MKILLSLASKFASRRTVLRWALNYLLGQLRKSRTDEQRAALMKDIRAIHTTTGHLAAALEDWKLTKAELATLEKDMSALLVELLT